MRRHDVVPPAPLIVEPEEGAPRQGRHPRPPPHSLPSPWSSASRQARARVRLATRIASSLALDMALDSSRRSFRAHHAAVAPAGFHFFPSVSAQRQSRAAICPPASRPMRLLPQAFRSSRRRSFTRSHHRFRVPHRGRLPRSGNGPFLPASCSARPQPAGPQRQISRATTTSAGPGRPHRHAPAPSAHQRAVSRSPRRCCALASLAASARASSTRTLNVAYLALSSRQPRPRPNASPACRSSAAALNYTAQSTSVTPAP